MSEKLIRIVAFTGKRNDWRQWSKKFLAVAEKREYRSILEVNPDKLDIKINAKKKMNSLAYNDLLLAMTEDVSFGLIDEATRSTYPEGDARKAWGKLMQRYESQTNTSRVKLLLQFTSSKLKRSTQDPDHWISELELMRIWLKKMGSNIDDEYLVIHIMNNLPSAYGGLIDNFKDKLDATLDPLTLSVLRDKISEKYEKIKRRKGIKEDVDSKWKKWWRRFRFCVKFQGKCNYCGKYGHKEEDCWANHGKPKSEETNNQAVEEAEDEVEVVLMSLEDNGEQEGPEAESNDSEQREDNQDHEQTFNEEEDETSQDQHDDGASDQDEPQENNNKKISCFKYLI